MHSIGSPLLWTVFSLIVVVMIAIDLFVAGGGREHKVSLREAALWSVIWVSLSFLFAAGLWWYLDAQVGPEIARTRALEFITGYLIEKSLSVDNVFVWLMLFSYFSVPAELQKRTLMYGVMGAIVLRTAIIFAGAWLVAQFHWILYLFGLFLLFTGGKMLFAGDEAPDLANNPFLNWLKRHIRITHEFCHEHFFVRINGLLYATPLFLALVLVEISDVIFATDSIPAIFAITTDPFIVLTSNIFAILGLRAMYFLLAGVAERFSLLRYGLALVLMFIGVKMLIMDYYKIPIGYALGLIAVLIIGSVLASLWREKLETTTTVGD